MERTVYISRADYTPPTNGSTSGGLLGISFDLAISPRSAYFNHTTTFSFVPTPVKMYT